MAEGSGTTSVAERAELHVLRGPQFGERLAVPDRPRVVIGRQAGTDVRLLGPQVAPRHCTLERDAGRGFVLRDLGSADGTFVNGRRVQETVLGDGDRIACGDVECRFVAAGARAGAAPPVAAPAAVTVRQEVPAVELLKRGAAALGTGTFAVALPCARESQTDRLCQAVLDVCRGVLGTTVGAVLRLREAGPPRVLALRRARGAGAEPALPDDTALLQRVTAERVAVRVQVGPVEGALAPVAAEAGQDVLFLGWDPAAGRTPPDALAAATAVGLMLGSALERSQAQPVEADPVHLARLFVETSDDVMFTLDEAGRVTFLNHAPASDQPAGEEFLGLPFLQLVPLSDRDDLLQALDRVMDGDERTSFESVLQFAGGGYVPVRLDLSPLRNPNGAVVGVRGIARDQRELQAARAAADGPPPGCEALLGESTALRQAHRQIARAQDYDYPTLICGEVGTGKEIVARALHACTERRDGPFVVVHCAAFPGERLHRELFGDRRRPRPDAIAAAGGGVLYLDEVDQMSAPVQAALLHALPDLTPGGAGSGHDLGGVRIIAGTHRDLDALAEQGRFSRALLDRLAALRIDLPPLRERPEDIPLLVRYGLRLVLENEGIQRRVGDAAMVMLARYDWPGNVRELLNVVRRAALDGRGGAVEPRDLPAGIRQPSTGPPPRPSDRPAQTIKEAEIEAIRRALQAADGNRKQAAAILGMPRATFYRRLKQYDML